MKTKLMLIFALLSMFIVGVANAYGPYGRHHGGWNGPRVGFGINVGPYPYYAPGFGYPYAPFSPFVPFATPIYPAPIMQVTPPPIIIQETPMYIQPAQAASNWYFCQSSNTYYPYVKECPEGWKSVPSQPPIPSASSPSASSN